MIFVDREMPLPIDSTEYKGRAAFETAVLLALRAVMVAAALLTLWSLTHHYRGLSGDGELYAVQALSKIVLPLGEDVFLRGASQDHYTVFSSFYGMFIGWFGVRTAAISLMIILKVWFYGASWMLIETFLTRRRTLLAVFLLIVLTGGYGAFRVFKYGEDFLTARTAAEAMVITAFALYFRSNRLWGALVALTASVVHPLMALPGLILLTFISVRPIWRAAAAAVSVVAALGVACYGSATSSSVGLFAHLDPAWLEVVRERSQFLFLQLWSANDWIANSRPFVSLLVTVITTTDVRIRQLGWSSLLLGVIGVLVAFIAGTIGPIAILLQGQAWRWLWIPAYISVALLVPTLVNVWRDEKCGLLCALLLIVGWTSDATIGLECLLSTLLIWSVRNKVRSRALPYLRWSGLAVTVAALVWMAKSACDLHVSQPSEAGFMTGALAPLRSVLGLQSAAALFGWLIYKCIGTIRSTVGMLLCTATFAATAAMGLPGAFVRPTLEGQASESDNFQDWRIAIPPWSNVYVTPTHNSAAFEWFTLQRPSYSSLDQSSGVVFSRNTALEIKRRSQNLLPVAPPDWKLLTAMKDAHQVNLKKDGPTKLLTRESLIAICGDLQLGFVIARAEVGFAPIKHLGRDTWKDWNLYDCVRVRASLNAM